ncbi:hypothetical protein [Paenibacillus sp. 2KB_22]|uniref:hypothetical protein n=1 Tax=Paenibacillus sp. 2KB_22 TaxID=3232978 RepID=UPI003F9550AE
MQYLFTALFILGFIAFLGFLVLMILSIRKGNRLPFKYIFLTLACFAIASIGLYGMLTLSSNSAQSGEDQPPSSQIKLSGLHMTADEFQNKFNGAVGKYRLNGLSITRLNMKESSEQGTGTFEYAFNDELRLVGVVNADESVQEVRLYGTGDTREPTDGSFLTAIATLILTTHSEYTYNDAQDVIQDIGLLDRNLNQLDFDGATVRNGLQYRFSVQDHEQSTFEISVAK